MICQVLIFGYQGRGRRSKGSGYSDDRSLSSRVVGGSQRQEDSFGGNILIRSFSFLMSFSTSRAGGAGSSIYLLYKRTGAVHRDFLFASFRIAINSLWCRELDFWKMVRRYVVSFVERILGFIWCSWCPWLRRLKRRRTILSARLREQSSDPRTIPSRIVPYGRTIPSRIVPYGRIVPCGDRSPHYLSSAARTVIFIFFGGSRLARGDKGHTIWGGEEGVVSRRLAQGCTAGAPDRAGSQAVREAESREQ